MHGALVYLLLKKKNPRTLLSCLVTRLVKVCLTWPLLWEFIRPFPSNIPKALSGQRFLSNTIFCLDMLHCNYIVQFSTLTLEFKHLHFNIYQKFCYCICFHFDSSGLTGFLPHFLITLYRLNFKDKLSNLLTSCSGFSTI